MEQPWLISSLYRIRLSTLCCQTFPHSGISESNFSSFSSTFFIVILNSDICNSISFLNIEFSNCFSFSTFVCFPAAFVCVLQNIAPFTLHQHEYAFVKQFSLHIRSPHDSNNRNENNFQYYIAMSTENEQFKWKYEQTNEEKSCQKLSFSKNIYTVKRDTCNYVVINRAHLKWEKRRGGECAREREGKSDKATRRKKERETEKE